VRDVVFELLDERVILSSGVTESWACVDCGVDTAPGCSAEAEVMKALHRPGRRTKVVGRMRFTRKSQLRSVRNTVWKRTGPGRLGRMLVRRCLEKRIGRKLKPKDFLKEHPLNDPRLPCTERLRKRRQ
jgi:hypothetical protein